LRADTAGRTCLEVVMRMLLKVVMDTEAFNERVSERLRGAPRAGTLERLRELLQPEASYFFVEDGQRASFFVFDLADPLQIPAIIEPIFLRVRAKITLTPCLTVDEADKAGEEAFRRMAAMQG
jgi:hypothetical protein